MVSEAADVGDDVALTIATNSSNGESSALASIVVSEILGIRDD